MIDHNTWFVVSEQCYAITPNAYDRHLNFDLIYLSHVRNYQIKHLTAKYLCNFTLCTEIKVTPTILDVDAIVNCILLF